MYLFFDTETTGLPKNWESPVTDVDNWPRLVQIAWIEYDAEEKEVSRQNYIIKPDGFTIPDGASSVHGITTERANERGVPLIIVLREFLDAIERSRYLIAHNMKFDSNIIGAEFIREEMPSAKKRPEKICTMLKSVDICKIEGKYGYKWPKLSELHIKLFDTDFDGAHDALVDVSACARCFFKLKKMKRA